MKRIVQKIFLGLFCMLLMFPAHALADGVADFGIHNNDVIFRLNDFAVTAENYRMLLFAETDFQEQRVWVCIYNRQYTQEQMKERYEGKQGYITGVPFAEKMAVQLFAENDGEWEECFELRKSRTKFSEITYTVAVDEEKTANKKKADANTGEEKLYILMRQNNIILPLEAAEELYGFHVYTEKTGIEIETMDEIFLQDPVLFNCTEKNRKGITLQEYKLPLFVHKQEETEMAEETEAQEPTETKTQEITEESTQRLTETETETQKLTETETVKETETETVKETETETAKETETETVKETETETAKETETGTAKETETETAKEMEIQEPVETETVEDTEIQKLAETAELTEKETQEIAEENAQRLTETEAVTQKLTETETQEMTEKRVSDSAKKKMPTGMIFAAAVLLILIGILLLAIRYFKIRKSKTNIEISSEDDEDTINPEEGGNVPNAGLIVCGAVINNKGRVRKNNEDNFYFNGAYMHHGKMDEGAFISESCQKPIQLYAVCDGMGGADSGEEASYRAVKELAKRKQDHCSMMDMKKLTSVLREISERINKEAMQRGQKSGTTIVMMLMAEGRVMFANVGDSRIYRFRNDKLTQISLDHSKVQRMISMGIMTPEQAKTDPGRHVITQYLGMSSDIKVSPYIVADDSLRQGDSYILCSDGLTDMVEDSRIEAILQEKKNPQDTVQELLKEAMNNGGRDNVTIMLLHVQERKNRS